MSQEVAHKLDGFRGIKHLRGHLELSAPNLVQIKQIVDKREE